jgi:hypothetical protein
VLRIFITLKNPSPSVGIEIKLMFCEGYLLSSLHTRTDSAFYTKQYSTVKKIIHMTGLGPSDGATNMRPDFLVGRGRICILVMKEFFMRGQ